MSARTAQPMPRAVARGPAMMRGKGVARAATVSPARLAARRLPHRAGTLAPVVRASAAAAPSVPDDAPAAEARPARRGPGRASVVMKFGGSSVADAERMREVASIVLTFQEEMPVLVLSAMGKTTNNLLAAGEQAMQCDDADEVAKLEPVLAIRKLHEDTMNALGVDDETNAEVSKLLNKMEQVCTGVALMQECTARTRATLVSFGERMSTRIFSSYLRSMGLRSTQHDAFDALGFVVTDEFENGNVLPVTYENVAKALTLEKSPDARAGAKKSVANIAVVTGFLGRGEQSGAIATLGRGGSDLTATVIGAALELPEVYVWKDVDGVLSADPREVEGTVAMAFLSFQEATELAYFGAQVLHPQSMRPAMDSEALCVRVKNSYNVRAPGTLIGHERPGGTEDWLLTSIVRKKNVTMLDIVSTRMLGQYGFLAKVFNIMDKAGISVDCVATSESFGVAHFGPGESVVARPRAGGAGRAGGGVRERGDRAREGHDGAFAHLAHRERRAEQRDHAARVQGAGRRGREGADDLAGRVEDKHLAAGERRSGLGSRERDPPRVLPVRVRADTSVVRRRRRVMWTGARERSAEYSASVSL